MSRSDGGRICDKCCIGVPMTLDIIAPTLEGGEEVEQVLRSGNFCKSISMGHKLCT